MDLVTFLTMQTPTERLSEALSPDGVGADVTITSLKGGPTPNTEYSIYLPPAKVGLTRYQSKVFTVDLAKDYFQFGFWVLVDDPDIQDADINLFAYRRNSTVNDISLELRAHGEGHALHLINAAGTSVASVVNPFPDGIWMWVETYFQDVVAHVQIGRLNAMFAVSDFEGDTGGNTSGNMYWEGQIEPGTPDVNNTKVYIAQGYFGQDADGTVNDLVSWPLLGGRDFEIMTYRVNDTGSSPGCDEGGVDGTGESLSAGTWDDTADDDEANSGDFQGAAVDLIGSAKAMDVTPDDGPAPHWNKWEACLGLKFLWITSGGVPSFEPYRGLYGYHILNSTSWVISEVNILKRNSQTEIFGLPGVGSFPTCPSNLRVGAMGGLVRLSTGLLKLQEMYLFACGLAGNGGGQYLGDGKPVGIKRSAVSGAGRVG